MPQMAPIFWSLMFLLFSMFLIFIFMKLSFLTEMETPLSKDTKALPGTKKNWQW